jgi:hypothetical protein
MKVMDKKTFWQRIKVADNKMAYGILLGIGIGLAMGVALGNWATGIAIGVGVGTALGAGWSQQAKHDHKE